MIRPSNTAAIAKWMKVAALTTVGMPAAVAASYVNDALTVRVMRAWSRRSLAALGLSLVNDDRNHGRYDDPPYLFVHLNQASLLETFVYSDASPAPLRSIINIEYALIPVVGAALIAMGSAVVVRQWPSQAKRATGWVARMMRERKHSFAMSIEGRRSEDGSLSPYKKGAAVLAIAAQARIVPFIVLGAREALPFGEWKVAPGELRTIAYEAIDTRGMTVDDRDALTARLRALAEHELGISEP